MEVLIAFKVFTLPWSGFVEYMTSTALSPSSWVKPIIDPEWYWAPSKQYCIVVAIIVVLVVVIPALPEKPQTHSAQTEEETVPKYYPLLIMV